MIDPQWQRFFREQTGHDADAEQFGDADDDRDSDGPHLGERRSEQQSDYDAALADSVICTLPHQGAVRAEGADALSFLQGQLSCDLRELGLPEEGSAEPGFGLSRLGAFCSPKGRVLALLRVVRTDRQSYLLLGPAERVAAAAARLRLFVLRARVDFVEPGSALIGLGISGAAAQASLQHYCGVLPTRADETLRRGPLMLVRVADGAAGARYAAYGSGDELQALWRHLSVAARPVGTGMWRLLDILAGVPAVYAATADEFVPQMLRLDVLGGVSFNKGCYVGQEVIARARYLGKLKRHLARLGGDGAVPPAPGDKLITRDSRTAGVVVDACKRSRQGFVALAVLNDAAVDEALRLADKPEPLAVELSYREPPGGGPALDR